ncbi:MAG: hypothetical protein M3R17_09120 [Bacteroidota bacterium]|nr:hypothetical protein [Bacteroidota bacterium]
MSKPKFAHIINTVSPADNASLASVQALTLETLRLACAQASGKVEVELLSAQYENARAFLPEGIRATSDLKECAADRKELNTKLKLPLLKEILSKLNESKDATHFIYTNLDICLMPFFYETVSAYVEKGHDALVINRRRISARYLQEKNMNLMYAEAGKTHTGYDCFVFSRELLNKFILKDIFIGTPPSGNDLFYNLFTFAENPVLFAEKHLTFHAGMDLHKPWGDAGVNAFNQQQFLLLLKELKSSIDISKFPGAHEGFFRRHFKWLMNPTFHYPTMMAADFKQLGRTKMKRPKTETPGGKSKYLEWLIRNVNFRDWE